MQDESRVPAAVQSARDEYETTRTAGALDAYVDATCRALEAESDRLGTALARIFAQFPG